MERGGDDRRLGDPVRTSSAASSSSAAPTRRDRAGPREHGHRERDERRRARGYAGERSPPVTAITTCMPATSDSASSRSARSARGGEPHRDALRARRRRRELHAPDHRGRRRARATADRRPSPCGGSDARPSTAAPSTPPDRRRSRTRSRPATAPIETLRAARRARSRRLTRGCTAQHDLVGIDHAEVGARAILDRPDVGPQRLDLADERRVAARRARAPRRELVELLRRASRPADRLRSTWPGT